MIPAEFAQRRRELQGQLGSGLLVALASQETVRNSDVHHPFRQNSDFYYLTGIEEPGAALVLGAEYCGIFVRPRDKQRELWDGPRLGVDEAKALLNADDAWDFQQLEQRLPELMKGREEVVYAMAEDARLDQLILKAIPKVRQLTRKTGMSIPTLIRDSRPMLHEMRRIKSPEEQNAMREAARISVAAHLRAMQMAAPGVYEFQLQAAIEDEFRMAGSARPAYGSIVGAGANATVLHYVLNRSQVQQGDLILIDAGCEFDYYAADITRTFPASGKFTAPQRELYEVVLAAQGAAMAAAKPGNSSEDVHAASLRTITEGLIALKLVEGPLETALSEQRYKPFFMHGTGHYLGMDVHDVGAYFRDGKPRPLDPGVVITVEPGIYVAPDNLDAPEQYRGLGIRIEDDLLITDEGHENLTAALPRSITDVEQACSG